jgi:hypothetical protein
MVDNSKIRAPEEQPRQPGARDQQIEVQSMKDIDVVKKFDEPRSWICNLMNPLIGEVCKCLRFLIFFPVIFSFTYMHASKWIAIYFLFF